MLSNVSEGVDEILSWDRKSYSGGRGFPAPIKKKIRWVAMGLKAIATRMGQNRAFTTGSFMYSLRGRYNKLSRFYRCPKYVLNGRFLGLFGPCNVLFTH